MSSTRNVFVTTIDNPYNPSEDFVNWFLYDESKGYHTCSKLDNITNYSSSFSDEDIISEIERAIDEMIRIEGEVFYKKIIISNELKE